jgi:beta-lactamase superfamily II metal-dependent hydrolase
MDGLSVKGTVFNFAEPGMLIDLGDGVMLIVLANETDPAASDSDEAVSILIDYGDIQWVLAGNLSAAGQAGLLQSGLANGSEVLYLPSATNPNLTSEVFLDAMQPLVIAVRVDPDTPPDQALIGTSERSIYRTDQMGSIEFITDGTRLWMQSAP